MGTAMATIVGLLYLEFYVNQAMSLKDKRRIVNGFKDRLRRKHNVSVAEVDGLDKHRRAVLAVAIVGNDKRYLQGALQKIINGASAHRDMILVEQEVEWL